MFLIGAITSTNMYANSIINAMRMSAVHLAAALSFKYFLMVFVILFALIVI